MPAGQETTLWRLDSCSAAALALCCVAQALRGGRVAREKRAASGVQRPSARAGPAPLLVVTHSRAHRLQECTRGTHTRRRLCMSGAGAGASKATLGRPLAAGPGSAFVAAAGGRRAQAEAPACCEQAGTEMTLTCCAAAPAPPAASSVASATPSCLAAAVPRRPRTARTGESRDAGRRDAAGRSSLACMSAVLLLFYHSTCPLRARALHLAAPVSHKLL
jgi:hypothetical protein